jgi:hypothetical protein
VAECVYRQSPRETRSFTAWHAACSIWAWEDNDMLWTIAVILGLMWLLGMVSSYTLGVFLHLLLLLAIVVVLINVIQGRRAI